VHVGVAEQLLDGTDVVAVLQQVRGEGMPQRVAPGGLRDARPADRAPYRLLDRRLGEVVSAAAESGLLRTLNRLEGRAYGFGRKTRAEPCTQED
jgi:hypothetical protein